MAEQTSIVEPIQKLPLKDRPPAYVRAEESLIPQISESEVGIQKAKGERDIAVREAAARRGEEMTAQQEKELAAGAEKIAKYELPQFKPSQEDLTTYAQLGSAIATLGLMLGGAGKNSAGAAMSAMTGMLNGWRQGRKDLYAQELKSFEKETQRISSLRKELQSELDRAMKLWPTKRSDAIALAENVAYRAGSQSVLAAQIRNGNLKGAMSLLESARKADEKQLELKTRLEEKQREAALTAAYRAQRLAQGGRSATQQQFMVQRAVNSLGGVASALESIVALPKGATTGWLPNLQTKDGMFNAIRNQLGRKISSVDAEMMNTLFSGIGRNLASIEASGAATGLTGLANQLQSGVYINAGVDDPYKVAIKLADVRRIASENIKPAIDSGLMTPQQANTARELVNRIEKVIPYSTVDVVNAYREAKKPRSDTVGGSASRAVSGDSGVSTFDPEKEARYQKWLKENPQ